MKTALKITGLLFGFLLFLSITVNDRPIFHHVYRVISPATKYAQKTTQDFFESSASSTHAYSKKLFDNSVPKLRDSVDSTMSGRQKVKGEPQERISTEDKEELDQLIKNH